MNKHTQDTSTTISLPSWRCAYQTKPSPSWRRADENALSARRRKYVCGTAAAPTRPVASHTSWPNSVVRASGPSRTAPSSAAARAAEATNRGGPRALAGPPRRPAAPTKGPRAPSWPGRAARALADLAVGRRTSRPRTRAAETVPRPALHAIGSRAPRLCCAARQAAGAANAARQTGRTRATPWPRTLLGSGTPNRPLRGRAPAGVPRQAPPRAVRP